VLNDVAAASNLVSDEMREVQGKILRRRSSFPVSASDIRRWAIAVYFPDAPPEAFLRAGFAGGEQPLIAPQEFNPFAWTVPEREAKNTDFGAGVLESQAGIAPPNLKFIVNGGSECQYGVAIKEGDVITSEFGVKSYVQKVGKQGPLLITETEDHWTNQRGERVKSTIMTLIRY
jgi:hypothetical protein